MNLHKSQTGFTALHGLLFLVIIGIICFAGWKVYSVGQDNKRLRQAAASVDSKKSEAAKETTANIPDGFVEYENKELGFKFAYPKDWQQVPLTQDDKKYGLQLSLISPAQKKAHDDFAKLGRATEGPYNSDLFFSQWDSINNESARGGSYLGEPASYKDLEDYLTHPNSMKQKIGEFNIGDQKVFEVYTSGFSQSYALMLQKPNGSIYQLDFINIGSKSDIDQTTKKIIDSIQIF